MVKIPARADCVNFKTEAKPRPTEPLVPAFWTTTTKRPLLNKKSDSVSKIYKLGHVTRDMTFCRLSDSKAVHSLVTLKKKDRLVMS